MNFQVNHGCPGCRMNAPEPRNLLILYHWRWQATTTGISDYWSVTHKDDLLEYIGYVPGCICTCIKHISPCLKLPDLKAFLQSNVTSMIRQDYDKARQEGRQTGNYGKRENCWPAESWHVSSSVSMDFAEIIWSNQCNKSVSSESPGYRSSSAIYKGWQECIHEPRKYGFFYLFSNSSPLFLQKDL